MCLVTKKTLEAKSIQNGEGFDYNLCPKRFYVSFNKNRITYVEMIKDSVILGGRKAEKYLRAILYFLINLASGWQDLYHFDHEFYKYIFQQKISFINMDTMTDI